MNAYNFNGQPQNPCLEYVLPEGVQINKILFGSGGE